MSNNTHRRLSSRAVIGRFFKRLSLSAGMAWIAAISMLFTSDQPSETYAWLGDTPSMREWIGTRSAKELSEFGIEIKNLLFEATLSVNVDDLDRANRQQQVSIRISELAARTVSHWAQLLSALILGSETIPCYDGQPFYSTTHPVGDTGLVNDNLLTVSLATLGVADPGTPTRPSGAAMAQIYLRAAEQIVGFLDDTGEPMNEDATQFWSITPIGMLSGASTAIKNQFLGQGETNPMDASDFSFKNSSTVRLNSEPASLHLFRTDGELAAYIRQEEKPVDMKVQAEGSPEEFWNRRHLYGVDAKRNVGTGRYEKAVKVKLVA